MDAEACACGISSGAEYGDSLGAVYGMANDDDDGMQMDIDGQQANQQGGGYASTDDNGGKLRLILNCSHVLY